MGKRRAGGIIGLIAALVIVVAGASIGIMAAVGVFSSDKAKAFQLLAQAPEKLSYSSVDEQLGISQLWENMSDKGSSLALSLSNLALRDEDGDIDLGIGKLSEYTVNMSAKGDTDGRSRMSFGVEKAGTPVTMNMYMDKEKIYYSMPELIKGKVFSSDYSNPDTGMMVRMPENLDPAHIEQYQEALAEFFKKEMEQLQEEITCEPLDGDRDGYKLTISKLALNTVLNDLVEFLSADEQKEMVQAINEYMQLVMEPYMLYELEDTYGLGGIQSFDLISNVRTITNTLSQYTQDFSFNVYGDGDDLTGIEVSGEMEGVLAKLNLDFSGVEGNSTATLTADISASGKSVGTLTVIFKDTKMDTSETTITVDVETMGVSVGGLTIKQTFNSSNNAYGCEIIANEKGKEVGGLRAKGTVKDLNPGSYVDYVMDEVSLFEEDLTYLSMALDIKLGVLEGSIEPLEGEEIPVKEDNSGLNAYQNELMQNFMKIAAAWGLRDGSGIPSFQDPDSAPNAKKYDDSKDKNSDTDTDVDDDDEDWDIDPYYDDEDWDESDYSVDEDEDEDEDEDLDEYDYSSDEDYFDEDMDDEDSVF
ncbi:MAG: hypothetical protein J1F02_06015 [Lachnospiraceae bacterium]|nr:hypothetical protein [Lachnospiraceae bacterium]